MKYLSRTTIGFLLLVLITIPGHAQTVANGNVMVHYSALGTTAVPEAVIKGLKIKPRSSHAIVVISPRSATDPKASLPASAGGTVKRLTGESEDLNFRTVEVGGYSDLLAEFEIQNGEKLVFDIEALVKDTAPIRIRFHQQFYRE